MARHPAPPWFVGRAPSAPLDYTFFLSHDSTDKDDVLRLKEEILAQSGAGDRPALPCFVDIHDWPPGTDPTLVMREALYASNYMVVWVTPAFLSNSRGWVWVEFAYGELLDIGLNIAEVGSRFPFLLPVFRGVSIDQVQKTPLLRFWHRPVGPVDRLLPIPEVAKKLLDFHGLQLRKRGVDPSPT
jgi:hypothetical protein